jgi:hypothetical protein
MGNGAVWDFSLTATELQAAKIVVTVVDAATKAVEDQCFEIVTFGNASAEYAPDFSDATCLGLSRLDATIGSRASQTSLDAVDDYVDTEVAAILAAVDTEVAAIKAKTDNLPAAPAATGDCITAAGVRTAVGLAFANLDAQLGLIYGLIDTEVGTAVSQTTAAAIRSALGLGSANLDTQLDALPTNAELATALGTADDAVLAAIAAVSTTIGVSGLGLSAIPKTGYKLASDGLDSISTTAPSGVASNFREMVVQTWRRWFKKTTLTSSQLKTYADDETTVVTTQTVSDDLTTQTQGAGS